MDQSAKLEKSLNRENETTLQNSQSTDNTTPLLANGTSEKKPLSEWSKTETAPSYGCCGPNLLVYISHFLNAWGVRMWQFAVGIFLVVINPDSLQLTAIDGLAQGASVLLLGPLIGDWVDRSPRLKAAQFSLVLQNVAVVLCSVLIYVYIVFRQDLLDLGTWTEPVTFALIILFASVANLFTLANTISVERDWVVEICYGNADKLATMTSTMKTIDLSTQILAPIATGQIMNFTGNENGCLLITGWNLFSMVAGYYMVWRVYNSVPALKKKKDLPKRQLNEKGSRGIRLFSGITIIIQGWRTYTRYPVMLSGFALSMLYMTVLGFDNVTVGYAKIEGLSESVIGIMMGAGGAMGILGALIYPVIRRWIGLVRTGMLSTTLLVTCLCACLVSVWLPGSPFAMLGFSPDTQTVNCTQMINIANTSGAVPSAIPSDVTDIYPCQVPVTSQVSVLVLMAGIIAARSGLWISDLTISQMFMETIIERERGVVNGVQGSMNKLMDMIKYALVISLPFAWQFGLLVIISFSFLAGAWLLYGVFVCRAPRNLFPRGNGGKAGYERI